ncbi:MAG: hypothetical protein ACRD1Y_02110, partial [Terriglobales bacterium]
MSRIFLVAAGTMLLGLATGLAAPSLAQAPGTTLAAGTKINSKLKTKLDTRHAKVGEKVTAVTTSDIKEHGVKVLPKGSVLTGHVTEVTRAKGSKSASSIGVLFDQAVTKKGRRIPLHASIVSVVSNRDALAMEPAAMAPMPMPMAMPARASAGGGLMGGVGGVVGGAGTAVGATGGAMLGTGAGMGRMGGNVLAGAHARASNGVPLEIAMPRMNAQGAGDASFGSVLSTPRGNMQLNSGTRMEVQQMGPGTSAA